jgi:hypothetical protein
LQLKRSDIRPIATVRHRRIVKRTRKYLALIFLEHTAQRG